MAQPIPAMTEDSERQNLFALAESVDLSGGRAIVEFGTFFGGSTSCLLNGVLRNPTRNPAGQNVVGYDAFRCHESSTLATHVHNAAKVGKLEHLLVNQDGWLIFGDVTRHCLQPFGNEVQLISGDISQAEWSGRPIALLHIDCPKSYNMLQPVLSRFLPFATEGAVVIFQDFFYHWSATVIATAQMLVEAGLIKYLNSQAPSMTAIVSRRATADDIAKIDRAMQTADITALIDRTKIAARDITIDRPDDFLPRLDLAKAQHFWSRGDYAKAKQSVADGIYAQGAIRKNAVTDVLDLLQEGFVFDIR